MTNVLAEKRIAILIANGFEQVEMTMPRKALDEEGAKTEIISPEESTVRGWKETDWGDQFTINVPLKEAKAEKYDALLLPGGVLSPDKLRTNKLAIDFIKNMYDSNKPIAAICHGPWLLINAGIARGRKITSWSSIKEDLINAGAIWLDEEVVRDGSILTSRNPGDIPAFNKAIIKLFGQ
ncbi:type 1 glutamine amidotransferase domain-containing protein [Legionella fairfieldensis]|uniref:type 1 glutamine amidotransferase domain-containing protein n=1 Tax=Legionella fairfieldensis TaxID=45064 RepID=UPI00048BB853|nr:type 1 glutamine amidotransferase domain-containing protein [Legionella fairfieldensis]